MTIKIPGHKQRWRMLHPSDGDDLCLCPGIFVGDLVTECKEALTEILTDPLTVFYYIYYIYYINTKDWLNKRSGLRPNIALDSMNPFASRRFGQFPAGSNHVRSRNMFLLLLTSGDLAKGEQFMEKEEFAISPTPHSPHRHSTTERYLVLSYTEDAE